MKIAIVVIALFVIGIVLKLAAKKGGGGTGTYKSRKLMTDNEVEFFGRLVAALPGHYIFPQVAMSALIESASGDKKIAHSDRLRIAQQRVDYVVCNQVCQVVAVVELDDKTHSKSKDDVRDERLLQVGIRTVRFQSKNKPAIADVRAAILPVPSTPDAKPLPMSV